VNPLPPPTPPPRQSNAPPYAIIYGIASIKDMMAAKRNAAQPGALTLSAYTDSDAAHLTFTNATGGSLFQCAKGVMTNTKTQQKVESVTVCSGDLAPHASIALEAPYPRYAIQSVCGGQPDRNGVRYIDWQSCTFGVASADTAPVGSITPASSSSGAPAATLPAPYSLDAGVPPLSARKPLHEAPKSAINTLLLTRTKKDDPVTVTSAEVADSGYYGNGKQAKLTLTSTAPAPPDKPTPEEKTAADNKTITVVKGFIYCFDAFDEPTAISGGDFVIEAYADDVSITPGGNDTKSWRLGYASASSCAGEITKIKYKDGTTWERPE
jgi:hypothetical protein